MNYKGQTALEYLLIIAGAIAIAAIAVYIAMSSMQSSGAEVGSQTAKLGACQKACIDPTLKKVQDCAGICMSDETECGLDTDGKAFDDATRCKDYLKTKETT